VTRKKLHGENLAYYINLLYEYWSAVFKLLEVVASLTWGHVLHKPLNTKRQEKKLHCQFFKLGTQYYIAYVMKTEKEVA